MKTNVIMIPRNHECIRKLRSSLSKTDIEVKLLRPFHYSSFMSKTAIVIPHGSFNESYENWISKREARGILDIPEGKKVVLCFGFIRKNRGYEYLIEATKDMEGIGMIIAWITKIPINKS